MASWLKMMLALLPLGIGVKTLPPGANARFVCPDGCLPLYPIPIHIINVAGILESAFPSNEEKQNDLG